MKNLQYMPHVLLLTTRQKAKIRNAFANNMSIDKIVRKTELSKIIQSFGFLRAFLGKLAGPLMKVAAPLAKDVLAPAGTIASAFAIDDGIQRRMRGKGVVKAGKGITLVI